MEWLQPLLHNTDLPAQSVFILALVGVVGLSLGRLKIGGISIGIAGMLFAGLAFGYAGLQLNAHVLHFARDFGLVLFVYTVGLQVGPGFISSLRKHGLAMNLMAAGIVTLGAIITVLFTKFTSLDAAVGVGLFSGATTNTPSLAAAQEALANMPAGLENPDLVKMTTVGYAMAYPGAILGIILTMLALRLIFRTPDKATPLGDAAEGIHAADFEISNPALNGIPVHRIPELETGRIVVSRIMHNKIISVAHPDSLVYVGDILHVVASREDLDRFQLVVGKVADVDLVKVPSDVDAQWVLITRDQFAGKTIKQLGLFHMAHVGDLTITRLRRTDQEFAANDETRVQLGDRIRVVGPKDAIERVAQTLGNSAKQLNHPHLIPLFVGITLGVLLGSLPIAFPGVPTPVKLGIAGGPLLVAILFGYLVNKGYRVGYMSQGANLMLRELGIVLFLGAVGINSGDQFVATLLHGPGLLYAGFGMVVTVVPLIIVGIIAIVFFKVSTPTLFGLLSGSMTDPPALSFANTMLGNDSPAVAYATVYPLVMMLRIVAGQILVILLLG